MVVVTSVELVVMKVEVTVDLVLVGMDDDPTPVLEELSGMVPGVPLLRLGKVEEVVLYVSEDD